MPPIIGIDLGTTNSLAAVMEPAGPKLIPNALGQVLTPSVVGCDRSGEFLVGSAARELQVLHPERCAGVFKRHMGSDWETTLAGQKLSAVQLSGCILRSLKGDAEAYLGESIFQAVITVPAYFNEPQRRATMAAGQLAGLEVQRILNEPTAAAIAYGFHEAEQESVAAIVDLGGGTFDVSIVEQFEGTLEIRASAGEIFLGGEDFTGTMAARILGRHGITFELAELTEPLRVARLRRECELAKRQLSREMQASVRLPDRDGNVPPDAAVEVIARAEFEEWTRPILDRITMPIRRALGDAHLKRGDVHRVILVGGATRMPGVIARVAELFQCEPRCTLNPDEVVALGASVSAGIIERHERLAEMVVTDVAPFTLGVEISRDIGGQDRDGYFLPIINRNTTIPVSRVERVQTRHPNQTGIKVSVYQGESRWTKDNVLLGEFKVDGIPRGPAGRPIDIRFTYDLNGVLEAEATIVETKQKATHVFTRHARGLSADEVASAVAEMQALKLHPREDAVNRFLLRRAERLFAELPLSERDILESLLCGFEEVLELRDSDAMEQFRSNLEEFLARFERYREDDERSTDGDSGW